MLVLNILQIRWVCSNLFIFIQKYGYTAINIHISNYLKWKGDWNPHFCDLEDNLEVAWWFLFL